MKASRPRWTWLVLAGLATLTAAPQARARVQITSTKVRSQVAETDHVTRYKLPDGRSVTRTVTEHDWIRKGKACSTRWEYQTPSGTRKTLLIDYVFNPGTRYKSSDWTANGTRFMTSSGVSPEGKVVHWRRYARHGGGTIREVGRWADGVRFSTTEVPTGRGFTTTTRLAHPDGRTALRKIWHARNTTFVHETVRRPDGTIESTHRRGQHRGKTLRLDNLFGASQ